MLPIEMPTFIAPAPLPSAADPAGPATTSATRPNPVQHGEIQTAAAGSDAVRPDTAQVDTVRPDTAQVDTARPDTAQVDTLGPTQPRQRSRKTVPPASGAPRPHRDAGKAAKSPAEATTPKATAPKARTPKASTPGAATAARKAAGVKRTAATRKAADGGDAAKDSSAGKSADGVARDNETAKESARGKTPTAKTPTAKTAPVKTAPVKAMPVEAPAHATPPTADLDATPRTADTPPAAPAGRTREITGADLWAGLKAQPRRAPAVFALAVVYQHGGDAGQQASWLARRYPGVGPERRARVAQHRATRRARRAAMAGVPFGGLAEAPMLGWTQARLVLEVAAIFGHDAHDPDRAVEMLPLLGFYDGNEAATAVDSVLDAARGPEFATAPGVRPHRLGGGFRIGRLATGRLAMGRFLTGRLLAGRLWPGAALVIDGIAAVNSIDELTGKAIRFYRQSARVI